MGRIRSIISIVPPCLPPGTLGRRNGRWARNAVHEARASPVMLRRKTSLALGATSISRIFFFLHADAGCCNGRKCPQQTHDRQAWSGDEPVSSRAEKESDDCSASIWFPSALSLALCPRHHAPPACDVRAVVVVRSWSVVNTVDHAWSSIPPACPE